MNKIFEFNDEEVQMIEDILNEVREAAYREPNHWLNDEEERKRFDDIRNKFN